MELNESNPGGVIEQFLTFPLKKAGCGAWDIRILILPVSFNKNLSRRYTQTMEPVILIILIGLAGGAAVGLQSPLASMISQRLGIFESVFIVHLGGAIVAIVPLS